MCLLREIADNETDSTINVWLLLTDVECLAQEDNVGTFGVH